jgi:hypothetical protein
MFDIGPILKFKFIDTKRHEFYALASVAYVVHWSHDETPGEYISKDTLSGYKLCYGLGYAFNFTKNLKAFVEAGWQNMDYSGPGQQWWKNSYGEWETGPGGGREWGDMPAFALGLFFEL